MHQEGDDLTTNTDTTNTDTTSLESATEAAIEEQAARVSQGGGDGDRSPRRAAADLRCRQADRLLRVLSGGA